MQISASGRYIGIFKFESSREGGLKVVFGDDFKVDSKHSYHFTFHDTSEGIDKKIRYGNVSINLLEGEGGNFDNLNILDTSEVGRLFCAAKIVAIDYRIPTSNAIKNYVDDTKDEDGNIIEEGILTKWHKENEYFHMQKSVADSLKSFNLDNYGVGDVCKGVIMNLPYLSKIKSISLVAVTADTYNQPIASKAMTWSNYRLKIVDVLSGEALATSEIGENANTAANTAGKGRPIGVFNFVNQIYCDAGRDYQILFENTAGETANIELAYANGNGNYATYENYTFGELAPKVILTNGTIKEHPPTFSVAGQAAVSCKGYACDFAVDTVKSEELTHLSKQIGELKNYIAYMGAYINQLKN